MITLPFEAVPGTTLIFNDYCNNAAEAKKYFIGHFSDPVAYETQLQFLSQRTYFREELTEILLRQNKSFQASDETLHAIESLRDHRTFAVLTGQQVGLFTGPLYTIYKALTAVHLAEWLSDRFPSHKFIPVFWLETEDHDIEEANEAGFLSRTNDFEFVHNGVIDPEIKNRTPVGGMQLGDTIVETVQALRELLQISEYSEGAFSKLADAYAPDSTYGKAFPQFFNSLFKDKGIVFVDPADRSLKQFLSPVIMREIETHPATSEVVISISAELEDHYHAQVKPRALNLFFMHNDKRYPIEPAETDYFLRGSRRRLSQEELVQSAEEYPELFSPNVLLRPVFQDYLFPTVAYVAGPSEVAYFAQLGPVYDHFQVPMPIIFPRASISIFERKNVTVLEKFNLPFSAAFASEEQLLKEILINNGGEDVSIQEYQALKTRLNDGLDMLKEFAVSFDANLRNPADSTLDNIHRALTAFEEKMFQMKKQQDEVTQKQVTKLLTNLLPEGKPQERMINVLTFLNKYGQDFLDEVDAACQPFPSEHRILLL